MDPVMIGDVYMMVLEKTGHDWSAVDVPKRQVHGVPTKVSARDKHNLPYRQSPLRFFGEAEIRNYSGILGGDWAADMLDRANNPKAQEAIWKQVIESETPTNLTFTINRQKIPVGNSLSLSYLNNAMYCNGAQFAYAEVDTASDLEIEMLRKYPDPINRPKVSSLARMLEDVSTDEEDDEEEYMEPEADYDDEGEEE
ncbi:DNA-directed RNA polymerase subunit beta [Serratia phage vB_SmaS-Totoro]|nr:DNA-directed RNA polymerase subunit beta [Serratia phage vB_SmaS-Totoro]